MKFLAAFATLIAVSNARPAEACQPAPTCGDEYCRGTTTVVAGTIEVIQAPDVEGRNTATINVTAVYGDSAGLVAGTNTIELSDSYSLRADDVGKSLVIGLSRSGDGVRTVDSRLELTDPNAVECFGASATSATVADALLSPSCYETLVPNPPANPPCSNGPFGCSAGGARGSLWVLAALGLVVRRRARRATGRRRAD